ncbi:MAG: hypothetical protein ICV86_11625 [Microcoleus sp. T3-bin5]|nr:hypothetical protein [Microcoleus sp. T3-bin5]
MTISIVPRLGMGRHLEEEQPRLKGGNNLEALPPNLHYQGLAGNEKRSISNEQQLVITYFLV